MNNLAFAEYLSECEIAYSGDSGYFMEFISRIRGEPANEVMLLPRAINASWFKDIYMSRIEWKQKKGVGVASSVFFKRDTAIPNCALNIYRFGWAKRLFLVAVGEHEDLWFAAMEWEKKI